MFFMLCIMLIFGFSIAGICSILTTCIEYMFNAPIRNSATKVQPTEEAKTTSEYIVVINPGDNPITLAV